MVLVFHPSPNIFSSQSISLAYLFQEKVNKQCLMDSWCVIKYKFTLVPLILYEKAYAFCSWVGLSDQTESNQTLYREK